MKQIFTKHVESITTCKTIRTRSKLQVLKYNHYGRTDSGKEESV